MPRTVSPFRLINIVSVMAAAIVLAGCALSLNPVTLAQRVVEDRSASDIAADTKIVALANAAMANNKVISVSTMIYEQQLVVYGLVTDRSKYDALAQDFRELEGVRQLNWHVIYISEDEKKRREDEFLSIADSLAGQVWVEKEWLRTEGIQSPNFRIGIDTLGTAYVMGRAASTRERNSVVDIVRRVSDVKRTKNYIVLRP